MDSRHLLKITTFKAIWTFILLPFMIIFVTIISLFLEANDIYIKMSFYICIIILFSLIGAAGFDQFNEEKKNKWLVFQKVWILIAAFLLLLIIIISYFGMMSPKKPAIYLYPEKDMQVQITVDILGRMTDSIPPYHHAWNVFVTKQGTIDGTYDYLFYEADVFHPQLPSQGWTVDGASLDAWFSEHLPLLGLNEKETRQFKDYWISKLPPAPYYEIRLMEKDFLNKMRLRINPEPDTEIRVILHFTPTKSPKQLDPPSFVTPERKGFTVVEWGGIVR